MPSKTAVILYKLIVNKNTRVADVLGMDASEMKPEDIEWLYDSIGEDWNAKQDTVNSLPTKEGYYLCKTEHGNYPVEIGSFDGKLYVADGRDDMELVKYAKRLGCTFVELAEKGE